jgi:N6-adenosine-specific RNA methylase IME4
MKYDIIYADPPWHYATRRKGTAFGGGVTDKYPTMRVPEICAVPVSDWAQDNSVLLIWTTMPYLMQTQQVIEAWGFSYITCAFTWIKTNSNAGTVFKGVGNYTKSNAELCLLGKRGSGIPRVGRDVAQVIMEPRREHSRKPDRVRADIVRLFGDRPRLEMFARTSADGWCVWGNETDKFE